MAVPGNVFLIQDSELDPGLKFVIKPIGTMTVRIYSLLSFLLLYPSTSLIDTQKHMHTEHAQLVGA